MATIDSTKPWNHTGIQLEAGKSYEMTATGEWVDKIYACGPDGYNSPNLLMRLAEFKRRVPKAKWFALIGAIDEDLATAFVIGGGYTFQAPRSGELTAFANDWASKYGNNRGSVELTVRQA